MRRSCLSRAGALAILAAAAPLAQPATPAAAVERRDTVLLMGNVAGFQTVTTAADGSVAIVFEFSDRGRGPHLESRIVLDDRGLPVGIETDGHAYFKNPVAERFAVEGGTARWSNRGESGETTLTAPAVYLSLDGTPEEAALLARALLAAPERRLALLPAGEARVETIGEREVAAGGAIRRLALHQIVGLGFEPTPVWLAVDGAAFATVSEWFSVVPEGWESVVPELLAAQKEAEAERGRRLAAELGHRPDGALAITGARLFDAESGAVRSGMTVLVEGERIAAVGADGRVEVPPGAEVIDAAGRTLLPGLWDMHTHLGELDGVLNLAAGVTTVRDLANDTDLVLELERRWDAGEAIGPRLVRAGFMDGPGPYAGPTKVLVDSEEEGRAAIDRYAELGFEQIKLYSSIRPELVPALVAHAHARGLRVSGHIPAFMTARQAVEAGYDEIQHANMLFLNFYPDVGDTRTPARFSEVAARGGDLDLDSAAVRDFVALLDAEDVVVDPTVAIFESMFTGREGSLPPGWGDHADRLPPQVRRGLLTGGLPVPEGMDERHRAAFQRMLDLVGLLHREGVTLVAGTDDLAGFTLHRELELYVAAGIPAAEALRLATLGAARVTGRDADLGSIAPGKLADLILVDGDPVARIADIRRVVTVVKGGTVYDAAGLYAAIGVRPAVAAPQGRL